MLPLVITLIRPYGADIASLVLLSDTVTGFRRAHMSYEQGSGAGVGDGDGCGPGETWKDRAGLILLGGADQEGEAAGRGKERGGDRKNRFETFDGAKRYYVEGAAGHGLGAGVLYIYVRQCKGAGYFAEEGGFFVVGLDEGDGKLRRPELDGKAGEAGAGAHIRQRLNGCCHGVHRRRHREQVAGGEKTLAKVAGDDVFGGADGCQVDAGVPAEEYSIYVDIAWIWVGDKTAGSLRPSAGQASSAFAGSE